MQAIARYPHTIDASRILTREVVVRALNRYRIPSYAWMYDLVREYRSRVTILEMWRIAFGAAPADLDVHDVLGMQVQFASRIDRELFPVDLWYLDDCLNSGEEDPFDCGLIPETYGLAWEMCDLEEISPGAIPIMAVLALPEILEKTGYTVEGELDGLNMDLLEWWQEAVEEGDLDDIPTWNLSRDMDGVRRFREALALLRPPLNALATVLDTVARDSGNPFLDTPGSFYRVEYDDFWNEEWCWCASCVKELTRLYEPVRERVEQMRAYYNWYCPYYDVVPHRRRLVVRTLARLVEGEWEIRDGELVFTNGGSND
jgi:hypothetical protein